MKIEYRRDVHYEYLVVSGGRDIDREAYPMRMIMENHIPGFLKSRVEEMDGRLYFYYDVTARQSLKAVMEQKPADATMLKTLFRAIPEAMDCLADYLLEPDGLLLSPDFIFMDADGKRLSFCYYPGSEENFSESLRLLGEGILPRLDHTDRKAVVLGYAFYQKCCNPDAEITADFFKNIFWDDNSDTPANVRTEREQEERRAENLTASFFEDDREVKKTKKRKKEKRGFFGFLHRKRKRENGGTEPENPSACQLAYESEYGSEYRSEYRDNMKGETTPGSGRPGETDNVDMPTFPPAIDEQRSDTTFHTGIFDGQRSDTTFHTGMFDGQRSDTTFHTGIFDGQRSDTTFHAGRGSSTAPYPIGRSAQVQAQMCYDGRLSPAEAEDDTQILGLRTGNIQQDEERYRLVFLGMTGRDRRQVMETGTEILLSRPELIIGKSYQAASVVLPDPTVSRVHAEMRWIPAEEGAAYRGTYVLQDLHSKNSTIVNGTVLRPEEEIALQDGDEIIFADMLFRYIIDAAAENGLS